MLAQLFSCSNSRSARGSAFAGALSPILLGTVARSLLLQILVFHVPLLNDAFDTAPLGVGPWVVCVALAGVVLWADEARKLVTNWSALRAGPETK